MTQSFFYPGHIDHDSEYGPVQFADGLLVPVGGLETAVPDFFRPIPRFSETSTDRVTGMSPDQGTRKKNHLIR